MVAGLAAFVFLLLFLMALRAYNSLGRVVAMLLKATIPLWKQPTIHGVQCFRLVITGDLTLSVWVRKDGRPWLSVNGGVPLKVIHHEVMKEFWWELLAYQAQEQSTQE
jgi:hypothetical protein